ncbi:hypothetical protein COO59_19200 [Mixta theicola]|uniref:Uncharacterized protein n=1 Tax=Mixta theicola TaxID=1458355 RepID=A0A2K1Q512_9GAMM|nr:hypothetical protein COO59_19200 [Mixta theicola]
MIKIAIKYIFIYSLMIISFMLFFCVVGCYIFVFDWGGNVICSAVNGVILISLVGASIAIYCLAEKIRLVF